MYLSMCMQLVRSTEKLEQRLDARGHKKKKVPCIGFCLEIIQRNKKKVPRIGFSLQTILFITSV